MALLPPTCRRDHRLDELMDTYEDSSFILEGEFEVDPNTLSSRKQEAAHLYPGFTGYESGSEEEGGVGGERARPTL